MSITIRKAVKDDFEGIQNLNSKLFKVDEKKANAQFNINWSYDKIGIEYFKNSIQNDEVCTLVTMDSNKIVGYLIGWIKKKSNSVRIIGKEVKLENMFITREYRN